MRILLTIITFLILLSSSYLQAQTVTESLISLNRQYAPLFSSNKSALSIDYLRITEVEEEKASYACLLQVNNVDLEKQAITIGGSIFGGGLLSGSGSVGQSNSYLIKRKEGAIVMDINTFYDFYDCINKSYSYISNKQVYGKEEFNTLATCSVENISFGAEYITSPSISRLNFFFKVDNAVFSMTQNEVKEIVKVLRDIKKDWTSRTNYQEK